MCLEPLKDLIFIEKYLLLNYFINKTFFKQDSFSKNTEMGKRKIHSFVKIEDTNNRNVTYCKRKKGLIKKAMELSMLCSQDVYLSIFDQERQKLVVYASS